MIVEMLFQFTFSHFFHSFHIQSFFFRLLCVTWNKNVNPSKALINIMSLANLHGLLHFVAFCYLQRWSFDFYSVFAQPLFLFWIYTSRKAGDRDSFLSFSEWCLLLNLFFIPQILTDVPHNFIKFLYSGCSLMLKIKKRCRLQHKSGSNTSKNQSISPVGCSKISSENCQNNPEIHNSQYFENSAQKVIILTLFGKNLVKS